MARRLLGLMLVFVLAPAASAAAQPYLPPRGKIWNGVTGNVHPVTRFIQQTGKHPAVWQFFTNWGDSADWWYPYAAQAGSRPMVHITTGGLGAERITPRGIAMGQGDSYLAALNRGIARSGQVAYIRLMAEMDGYWNPY